MEKRFLHYIEREQAILSYLNENKFATTEEMCQYTGASPATIRRDFTTMSKKGLLKRSRGGIQILDSVPPTSYLQSTAVFNEIDEEKSRIAKFATRFVNENDCIFIGAGKTCNIFSSSLRDIGHLTVVTTNITAVLELTDCPTISLMLLGGDIHVGANFVETISSGSDIEKYLGSLYFDKVFITVDGIDLNTGYTIKNRKQVSLYSHLINASNDFYVLADSYKFNRHAFVPIFGLEQIHNIITTPQAPEAYLNYFKEKNKNFYLA